MGVKLIDQQGGAGAGAALADIALVDDHRVDARLGQAVGDQRAGNAAADHRHLAAEIVLEGRVGCENPISNRPERVAGL
jgi:hypothetical protein